MTFRPVKALSSIVPIDLEQGSGSVSAYAAYGGIYIAASLVWLRAVNSVWSDRWDVIGAAVCLVGAGVILFGPRVAT